jgi:prepilin-type N-terminal cleavage/methylation domain-containing protein
MRVRSAAMRGFTLIEMSVVLVVIALLIGGILAGQSMYRQSKLRNLLVTIDTTTDAIKLFKDKYNALPGDMYNAADFWGTDAGGCPSGGVYSVPKKETCNGNGDGRVAPVDDDAATSANPNEAFRAWQHLADAGFIKGTFSGLAGPGGANDALVGINVPETAIENVGLFFEYYSNTADGGSEWLFPGDWGHVLGVGSDDSGYYNGAGFMTPAEMMALDQKSDDGRPGTGRIRTYNNRHYKCSNGTDPATALYDVTQTDTTCGLLTVTSF